MKISADKCRAFVIPAALLVLTVLLLVIVDASGQSLTPLSRSSTDLQATLDRGLERANAYAPYGVLGGLLTGSALAMNPSRIGAGLRVGVGSLLVGGVWILYNGARWLTGN